MQKQIAFCLCMFIVGIKVYGQADSLTSPIHERYFSLSYDNDFFRGTDRYYTQGIIIDLVIPVLRKNPLSNLLLRIPESKRYDGLKIQQDGFTPRSIRHDSIYFGERPYASVLFFSFYRVSLNKTSKQSFISEIYLGVIGPYGKGEEEQKRIHKSLNNIQPLGWEYQIKNDIVLNYNIQYEKGIVGSDYFEFNVISGARAGTLYDDIDLGFRLRCGLMQSYFDNMGLSKDREQKKFQCYFYIKETGKLVIYNATLQGGLFNKNSVYTIPANEIKRFTSTTSFGLVIAYNSISIEFAETYITREFKTGLDHGWGHCNLKICF